MTRLAGIPVAAVLLALGASLTLLHSQPNPPPTTPATPPSSTRDVAVLRAEVEKLRVEVERLKGLVPDQAHAMEDVRYHFANRWFAAGQKNWPLAGFYLAETRSHLHWAVRIIPIRKTSGGAKVDLKGILEAIDNTEGVMLPAIKTAIERQDYGAFTNAYRQTIEGCYACHKASEKPFIRPQIPNVPVEHIINMEPGAQWPE